VRLVKASEHGRPYAQSDMPDLGSSGVLVLRERALVALREVLEGYGEFLPLACEEADLWAFNCTRVVDALDEGRSTIRRFPNSNKIMRIQRYEFRPEALVGVRAFRLPQLQPGPVYVNEEVGEAVRAAELRGVGFKLLWEGSPSGA